MSNSSKSAAAFLTRLSTDETLRARISAATPEEFLAVAATEGCQFTTADLKTAVAAASSSGGEVLSDSDLEQMAGGLGYGSAFTLVKKFLRED